MVGGGQIEGGVKRKTVVQGVRSRGERRMGEEKVEGKGKKLKCEGGWQGG